MSIPSGKRHDKVYRLSYRLRLFREILPTISPIQNMGASVGGNIPIRTAKKVLEAEIYSLFYSPQFANKTGAKYFIYEEEPKKDDEVDEGNEDTTPVDGDNEPEEPEEPKKVKKYMGLAFAGFFEHDDSKGKKHELVVLKELREGKQLFLRVIDFNQLSLISSSSTEYDLTDLVLFTFEMDLPALISNNETFSNALISSVFFQGKHNLLISVNTDKSRFLKRFLLSINFSGEEIVDDVVTKLKLSLSVNAQGTDEFRNVYGISEGEIKPITDRDINISEEWSTPYVLAKSLINISPYHKIEIEFKLTTGSAANVSFTIDDWTTTLSERYPSDEDYSLKGITEEYKYKLLLEGKLIAEDKFKKVYAYYHYRHKRWTEGLGSVWDYQCDYFTDLASAEGERSTFSFAWPGDFSREVRGNSYSYKEDDGILTARHALPSSGFTDFPYAWGASSLRKVECENNVLDKRSVAAVSRVSCFFLPKKKKTDGSFDAMKLLYVLLENDFFEKRKEYDDEKNKKEPDQTKINQKKEAYENSYKIKRNDFSEKEAADFIYLISSFGRTYIIGLD